MSLYNLMRIMREVELIIYVPLRSKHDKNHVENTLLRRHLVNYDPIIFMK